MTNVNELVAYKTMPVWTASSLPQMFQEKHNTKEGTWAKLTILKGKLKFFYLTEEGDVVSEHEFDATNPAPFIEPQVWHKVQPLTDDLECFLEFYCTPENYFAKKYNLSTTHGDVVAASKIIAPCKTLDLGCGGGRNSLYLAKKGFEVTSVDHNAESIAFVQRVAAAEDLNVNAYEYNIETAAISENYDFILSTVVLMFLNANSIPQVIKNMQEHTNPGGYNLIVAAMSTPEYPCPMPFPFTFSEGELKNYYQGWEFLEYNENLGHLHKIDIHGNRIQLKFATMLARKPQ
ncbi:SAM-dependent methyltransferase TehB [Psittacicella hinzii]|uniref:Tellurite resistance methyltransferase TehB n=1 Tax=Psittacicella hinzii TaxID=2028575 RepID=A0A3A1YMA8_9GAMM|nr:SAM-dependent methyltransferase TehB [Psittacicella hinzii]RIY38805.1 tellurite resistance methyltransferase TehB [Psittacicella hinzii]